MLIFDERARPTSHLHYNLYRRCRPRHRHRHRRIDPRRVAFQSTIQPIGQSFE